MTISAPRPDVDRLTFDDLLFETMRRVLGTPVVSQTVWRFEQQLDLAALRRFHAGLCVGPLNRRLRRTRVPAARDSWVVGGAVPPLVTGAVAERPMAWLDAHTRAVIDPVTGPAWELAYAPVSGGGSLLSFVTSHVVADGGLKLLALEAAACGQVLPVLPSGGPAASVASAVSAAGSGGWRDDVADGLRQVGAAAHALPGLFRRRAADTRSAPTPRPAPIPARPDDDVPWTPPVVVLDLPASGWLRCAEADGGSANALLLAVCAELAAAAGRAAPEETIRVASPVSTRADGDLRSNASTGVSVPVALDRSGRAASLADVRAGARTAYAALADQDPAQDPLAAARMLLPLLPGALIRRLAPTWPAPLVLASNLGTLSPRLVAPTGTPAIGVLNRSITPPTTRGAARRTRAGLSAWWGTAGRSATLCVAGADPDAFPDVATLRDHLESVLARRGLGGAFW